MELEDLKVGYSFSDADGVFVITQVGPKGALKVIYGGAPEEVAIDGAWLIAGLNDGSIKG